MLNKFKYYYTKVFFLIYKNLICQFYEHTYIATPDCNKKDIDNIEKKIESILTSNAGKIVRKEDWGLRNLAYPIKKMLKEFIKIYILRVMVKAIKEIEYFERYNDKVMKFLSIKLKKLPKEDLQLKNNK